MSVYSNRPPHAKASWRRPTFTRTTAADYSAWHFGWLRSSCGHRIGWAWVRHGRQWVLQWAVCR